MDDFRTRFSKLYRNIVRLFWTKLSKILGIAKSVPLGFTPPGKCTQIGKWLLQNGRACYILGVWIFDVAHGSFWWRIVSGARQLSIEWSSPVMGQLVTESPSMIESTFSHEYNIPFVCHLTFVIHGKSDYFIKLFSLHYPNFLTLSTSIMVQIYRCITQRKKIFPLSRRPRNCDSENKGWTGREFSWKTLSDRTDFSVGWRRLSMAHH